MTTAFSGTIEFFLIFMLISLQCFLSPLHFTVLRRGPLVEWWNWQTRMIKGHVPRGVRVQVPLRPPLLKPDGNVRFFCAFI